MKVQLRLFATFRQYQPPGAQAGVAQMEVPVGTRVGELLSQVGVPQEESPLILVNGRGVDPGQVLVEGDAVAVFPAMGGG